MQILTTVEELRAWSRRQRSSASGEGIALVPTLGALHAGHASLIRAAAEGATGKTRGCDHLCKPHTIWTE